MSHRLPDWFLNCPSQKASSTHPVHPPAPQRAQQVRGHAGLDGGRGGLREVDSTGENPSRATSPLIIDFQQLIVLTCTQFSNYDEDYNEEGNENECDALKLKQSCTQDTFSPGPQTKQDMFSPPPLEVIIIIIIIIIIIKIIITNTTTSIIVNILSSSSSIST